MPDLNMLVIRHSLTRRVAAATGLDGHTAAAIVYHVATSPPGTSPYADMVTPVAVAMWEELTSGVNDQMTAAGRLMTEWAQNATKALTAVILATSRSVQPGDDTE